MGFWAMIGSFFLGLILVVLSFQAKIRRRWPQYLLLFARRRAACCRNYIGALSLT